SMIGYVTLGSNDLERARAFYSALLAEIGGREVMRLDNGFTMYGTGRGQPGICITKPTTGRLRCQATATWSRLCLRSDAKLTPSTPRGWGWVARTRGRPGCAGRRGRRHSTAPISAILMATSCVPFG